MDQFQWILRKPGKDCKLQNLQRIIRKKIFIAVVWYQRLTMGNVFTPEISSQIEILVKDNECSSFEENNDLESVSMLLQYYILEYMNTARINNRRLFKKCIDFFEMLISKSLTFSQ